jgi:hypothetical protein|tara:strand:+ start:8851 stop:9513 length:663 start_codon:yes stop_codon:yes gene_type:complete
MKKLACILLWIVCSHTVLSQTITQIDSVSQSMCLYLNQMDIKNDTLAMNNLYNKKVIPYLNTFEASKMNKVGQQVYYRLQRNCVAFRELLDRIDPPKESVSRLAYKPKSEVSDADLQKLKNAKKLYYFEVSGDTTQVLIKDGKWLETFADNTYSNLDMNWITNTEFELVFNSSNNETRSNFSVQGDTYIYQVLTKENDYFVLSVNIPGQPIYEKLKIYHY